MSYRPLKWLVLAGEVGYTDIDGEETIVDDLGGGMSRYNVFSYDSRGVGDISLMGWAEMFTLMSSSKDKSSSEDEEKEPPTVGDPALYLGVGVKLPTGKHDDLDREKFLYDRANSIGELSDSDGLIPSYFQLGTGTTDGLFGAVYQQRFGRFVPQVGVTYTVSGGSNSKGYERSDVLGWSLSTKFILMNLEDCRQLYVRGGLSGVYKASRDIDHSENNRLAGQQENGRVPDTDGAFNYCDVGLGYDFTEFLTANVQAKFPLNNSGSSTNFNFDKMFSVSVLLRF